MLKVGAINKATSFVGHSVFDYEPRKTLQRMLW